jgi:disulfide bond formation protein DsbB
LKQATHSIIAFLVVSVIGLSACNGESSSDEAAQSGEIRAAQASTGDAIVGQRLFTKNCSACHGPAGEGVQGLGKALTTSEFVAGKTDEELVAFIKVGRDPKDPLNTTGIRMYPKGGNPDLTDADLFDIVAHIRNINSP